MDLDDKSWNETRTELTLKLQSPHSRTKATSSTGPVSQTYNFFECLEGVHLVGSLYSDENLHYCEECQVVYAEVLWPSSEVDRRGMESNGLGIRYGG